MARSEAIHEREIFVINLNERAIGEAALNA
jgi:hypothetical protein